MNFVPFHYKHSGFGYWKNPRFLLVIHDITSLFNDEFHEEQPWACLDINDGFFHLFHDV
jgi:hypothetical protein